MGNTGSSEGVGGTEDRTPKKEATAKRTFSDVLKEAFQKANCCKKEGTETTNDRISSFLQIEDSSKVKGIKGDSTSKFEIEDSTFELDEGPDSNNEDASHSTKRKQILEDINNTLEIFDKATSSRYKATDKPKSDAPLIPKIKNTNIVEVKKKAISPSDEIVETIISDTSDNNIKDSKIEKLQSDSKKEKDYREEIEKFVKETTEKLAAAKQQLDDLRTQREDIPEVRLNIDENTLNSINDFNEKIIVLSENTQLQIDETRKMINPEYRLNLIDKNIKRTIEKLSSSKERNERRALMTKLQDFQEEKERVEYYIDDGNIDENYVNECKDQEKHLQSLLEATSQYEKDLWKRVNPLEERRQSIDQLIDDLEKYNREILEKSNETSNKFEGFNALHSRLSQIKSNANEDKKILNAEIQKSHESLKDAREKLGTADHPYLLKEQRINEISSNPNIIRATSYEVCMIASGRTLLCVENSKFHTQEWREKIIKKFQEYQGDWYVKSGVVMDHFNDVMQAFEYPEGIS